jgi:hypothetical protein
MNKKRHIDRQNEQLQINLNKTSSVPPFGTTTETRNNITPNTVFKGISCTIIDELIPSKKPQKCLELPYTSLNHPATSGAK